MSESAETVSVIILEKQYQFSCPPEERNELMEAARKLDESMTAIRESGRLMSLERIALQAALNFSAEVLSLKQAESEREQRVDRKIRDLADRLDTALQHDS
ncbi:MAG: cell division protein ZapA [Lysobacterales bacterium]